MENRPIILDIQKTKENLAKAVNTAIQQYHIPCYLLAPVIAALHQQVREQAQTELEVASAQYAEQRKKEAQSGVNEDNQQ